MNKYNVDLNAVLIKPLYIGLLMNIFIPVVIIAIAYFIEDAGGLNSNMANENLELIFWVLVGVAVVDGAVAIFLKQKFCQAPMIKSKETFGDDLKQGMFMASIICFSLTTAISVYGLVVYLLGGTFNQLLFFAFLSFIAFQLIRPRLRFAEKVLALQERHLEDGRLAPPKK